MAVEPMFSKPALSPTPTVELTETQGGQHPNSVRNSFAEFSDGGTTIYTASASISLRFIGEDLSRPNSKLRCPRR